MNEALPTQSRVPEINVWYTAVFVCTMVIGSPAEPVVVTGAMVKPLLGARIEHLNLTDAGGTPIPFQIDEITPDGEYVCPLGKEPNTDDGNGVLDARDEIVFLRDDASPVEPVRGGPPRKDDKRRVTVTVGEGAEKRGVLLWEDPWGERSPERYIQYDHADRIVETPYYFARFGARRFHFVQAGIRNRGSECYVPLTKELRVKIYLRALWGLLPITYNEENIVCLVKRFKVGPIRLIRRGDFHLNIGLWLKGSRAAVNQICYAQMVRVPVYLHLPIRFSRLFGEAWIEMSPVLGSTARTYSFTVPRHEVSIPLGTADTLDTLLSRIPTHGLMSVNDGSNGYAWVLQADIPDHLMNGSGYVVQRPSKRGGIAHCGYRLTVGDLPRGNYLITNWVLFGADVPANLARAYRTIVSPSTVTIDTTATFNNAIDKVHAKARK